MRAHEQPDKDTSPGRRPPPIQPTPAGKQAEILALQRSLGNKAVAGMVEEVQDVLHAPGKPLDEPVRDEMETRLGADFSDVRVHTGTVAQRSAEAIGARAYTSGNHVVIGQGGADKHTLAHELTHVIQQRSGAVEAADHGSGLRISDPSDRFERAAEANATQAMAGNPVQRMADESRHQPPLEETVQRATPGATPAIAAPAAPAVQETTIREGEVREAAPGGRIRYPSVTSCLTVTVHLRTGGMVGAHISIFRAGSAHASNEILPALRTAMGTRHVAAIEIVGEFGTWNSAWLTTNVEDQANTVTDPEPNARQNVLAVVQQALGHEANKYTTRPVAAGETDVVINSRPSSESRIPGVSGGRVLGVI
jgi:hypothetical protein